MFTAEHEVDFARSPSSAEARPRWITARRGLPYFLDETGAPWTPVGHNEAITWPNLAALFRRRDPAAVERHLRELKAQGVTCLRLMLEYCHGEHRYLEPRVGMFAPNMVRLWDDLFALLERVGLHVLLTPYDTFFMWTRWAHHPYNARRGGPSRRRQEWLTCAQTRQAIKHRLAFASDRWGGSPALFAWDLFNEINPVHGGGDTAAIAAFITDIGPWLRAREAARHGRSHLQTVSIFDPDLARAPDALDPIFRHPDLDFATTHFYERGTIDDPRNTVAPALAAGRLVRRALGEITDLRPFLDSEHGPIHRFKDRRKTLPEAFDDECFRHFQWAHLASGGAGGGMRWPNRHPHVLTPGMHRSQAALAAFLPLIDWSRFRRRNLNAEIALSDAGLAACASGDDAQAIVWLVARDSLAADGTVRPDPRGPVRIEVPGLDAGDYRLTALDPRTGRALATQTAGSDGRRLVAEVEVAGELVLAIRALAAGG